MQFRLSFFSLLYGTPANISRKPATRGMASQLAREWTFPRVLEISQGAWKRSQIKELHNKGSDIVFIKSRNRSDVEPLSIIIGLNSRVGANSNEPEN